MVSELISIGHDIDNKVGVMVDCLICGFVEYYNGAEYKDGLLSKDVCLKC